MVKELIILFVLFIVFVCCNIPFINKLRNEFTLLIQTNDKYNGLQFFYRITANRLQIEVKSEQKIKVLFQKDLTEVELNKLERRLSLMNLTLLESEYIDNSISEGNQYYIQIQFDNITKQTKANNYYVPELYQIISLFNEILDNADFSIKNNVNNSPINFVYSPKYKELARN